MISVLSRLLPLSGNSFCKVVGLLLLSNTLCAATLPDSIIFEKKDRFTISFLLPLKLDALDTLNPVGASDKFDGNVLGLDFWQGAKLALDTLSKMGVNLTVNVLDADRKGFMLSSSAVLDRLGQSDLVIGPVFPDKFKGAALFSSTYKVPMVSPLAPSSLLEYKNPYFIGMYPTLEHHARTDAAFIKQKFGNDNVVILRTGDATELKLVNPLVAELQKLGKAINSVKVVKSAPDFALLDKNFPVGKRRVLILPSTSSAFINMVYNHLSKDSLSETVVFTHPNFDKTENLNIELLQRMNTYTSSAYRVDYTKPNVIAFLRTYRDKYATDPSETAIRAYDMVYYFGVLWQNRNTDFINCLTEYPMELLHGTIRIERVLQSGYHNTAVDILKYQDFNLIKTD